MSCPGLDDSCTSVLSSVRTDDMVKSASHYSLGLVGCFGAGRRGGGVGVGGGGGRRTNDAGCGAGSAGW